MTSALRGREGGAPKADEIGQGGGEEGKNRPLHCRPQFLIFTPRPPHFTAGESQAGKNITFILIKDG